MKHGKNLIRFIVWIIITSGCFNKMEGTIANIPGTLICSGRDVETYCRNIKVIVPEDFDRLKTSIKYHLTKYQATNYKQEYLDKCKNIVDTLIQKIDITAMSDQKIVSESCYYIGVYFLFVSDYFESIRWLNITIKLIEGMNKEDQLYAKALYNLGIAYYNLGDFKKHEYYSLKSLEAEKKIFGEESPHLVSTYLSLVSSYINLQEYNRSISLSNIGLAIADKNPDSIPAIVLADLHTNLGVCYSRLEDFSKAIMYFDIAELIYKKNNLELKNNYINLMNSMAIALGSMNLTERSYNYYEKGIERAFENDGSESFNIINSYAIILANTGKKEKGEILLRDALARAKKTSGEDSRNYIEVLRYYAEYLYEYNIDNSKSLECYSKCINYLSKNDWDNTLKSLVFSGYSLSLAQAGQQTKALQSIRSILFPDSAKINGDGVYANPPVETIIPDKGSLSIYKAKHKILRQFYKDSNNQKVLEAAANTSELIVSLLEKIRINISEEDSRLVLGDRYRDAYLDAIGDFYLLYIKTADKKYLGKAFEYSEKSKVAGLLTSTRELKASQFHIPAEIAGLEKTLQRDVGLLNARIAEESAKEIPDIDLTGRWKESLLKATRERDSLILFFEKQYPEYYDIKYNTQVAALNDISGIIGRNGNYINYVASDTILYIFIANRKHKDLLAISVDSGFYNNIRNFRRLLSIIPSSSGDARGEFESYQSTGYQLYKTLIDPLKPFLISDKLFISPDNIISYLPFEAIPTSTGREDRIMYRNLQYLMNEFDISYTYSATFMQECEKRNYSSGNELIAFAPDYPEPINIQSVLMSRQAGTGNLTDLPFAREEAEYVTGITGGTLYENSNAKESIFKNVAGKFDIIHLAMHTLLNDKDPMHSTLIFSRENDSTEDRFLKTYEVYGIPLKAKMVVLSSCNTGSGILYSGEGIVSLARGFIYSGSQSVVMSMWEIEDKSGTDIIKMYYDNLKKGNSKSVALRKARTDYLKNADQLRSHPYFWSTLVIYGDNKPLFKSKSLIYTTASLFIILTLSLLFYLRRRKYS